MRSSMPIARATSVTSAPVASHISETALMNEILVARKALAEALTSSAASYPITRRGASRSRIRA